MVSRRRFVNAAAATLVAAGVPAVLAPPAAAAGKYSAAWWRKRLGAQVEFQGDQWHLGAIRDVRGISSSPDVEQFTILFRGSVNDLIPEGTYVVKVGITRVKLFLQPSGGDDLSNFYVASVAQLQ
jgi:hypothetical protein